MIGRADKNGPQGDGVNEDVSFTLNTIDRHGVCHASGFCTEHSAKSRTIGYEDERSPTLRARRNSGGTT
jgi:DNA (cytosine-5)-methyltransferase 1